MPEINEPEWGELESITNQTVEYFERGIYKNSEAYKRALAEINIDIIPSAVFSLDHGVNEAFFRVALLGMVAYSGRRYALMLLVQGRISDFESVDLPEDIRWILSSMVIKENHRKWLELLAQWDCGEDPYGLGLLKAGNDLRVSELEQVVSDLSVDELAETRAREMVTAYEKGYDLVVDFYKKLLALD